MQNTGRSLLFGIQFIYLCFAEQKCKPRSLLDKGHNIPAIIVS